MGHGFGFRRQPLLLLSLNLNSQVAEKFAGHARATMFFKDTKTYRPHFYPLIQYKGTFGPLFYLM